VARPSFRQPGARNSNVLSTSTSLTLASGTTLSLNGTSSQRLNTLNFTDATIDFGTTGTANYLLLGMPAPASGTLTITKLDEWF